MFECVGYLNPTDTHLTVLIAACVQLVASQHADITYEFAVAVGLSHVQRRASVLQGRCIMGSDDMLMGVMAY